MLTRTLKRSIELVVVLILANKLEPRVTIVVSDPQNRLIKINSPKINQIKNIQLLYEYARTQIFCVIRCDLSTCQKQPISISHAGELQLKNKLSIFLLELLRVSDFFCNNYWQYLLLTLTNNGHIDFSARCGFCNSVH